jgi:plasmid stabilization system protein ParE
MTQRTLVIRAEAREDVETTSQYYDEKQAALRVQFLRRLNDAIDRIRSAPELYGVVWRDVRAKRLKTYPFIVYSRLHDAHIEIVAVLHGSRDSSVWQSRV